MSTAESKTLQSNPDEGRVENESNNATGDKNVGEKDAWPKPVIASPISTHSGRKKPKFESQGNVQNLLPSLNGLELDRAPQVDGSKKNTVKHIEATPKIGNIKNLKSNKLFSAKNQSGQTMSKGKSPVDIETATAEQTLYLCNFRVSVDGDWLCLRELADVQIEQHASSPEDGRDPMTIERCNLLNVFKLLTKELIDSSLAHGRMLDDDHVPLQQFFVVLEHIMRHGLKPKKGILRDRRDFWCVVDNLEKIAPEVSEITTSVKEMPNIKTPLGRARAWLRLAMMQKTLADHFSVMIENKDIFLSEFYENGAMLMEEEGMVMAGMLVGLNVIDCNLCIKEEDFDQPMGVIDFSLYLQDNNNRIDHTSPESESTVGKSQMATILDQKNYLEELNRHLNATVTNLQQKVENFQTSNALMKEDLAIAKNAILTLQAENEMLKDEKSNLSTVYAKQIEATKQDIDAERTTYQTSRAGLDNMYEDIKKKFYEETQNRLDMEKELELQISMKTEMEMALRLLEKDIHEKQDNIVTLRKQLDEIKAINLEMYKKLQDCEVGFKHKSELVSKLEEKTNQLVTTMKDMEKKLKQCDIEKHAAEETARKLGQMVAEKDAKKTAVETDLRIEREWRGTLQKNLEGEKEKVGQLHLELQQMKDLKKEYDGVMQKHVQLKSHCEEQERALSELGGQLSQSKLSLEDMKEAQMAIKEAQWAEDKDITHCKQCEKAFSVARRKHHCRNCGDIFCNECSDNKMPHPSSSKPVRVCDECNEILLQRYNAK